MQCLSLSFVHSNKGSVTSIKSFAVSLFSFNCSLQSPDMKSRRNKTIFKNDKQSDNLASEVDHESTVEEFLSEENKRKDDLTERTLV